MDGVCWPVLVLGLQAKAKAATKALRWRVPPDSNHIPSIGLGFQASRLALPNFDMATCFRDSRELAHQVSSRSLQHFSNESKYGVDQNLCKGLYIGGYIYTNDSQGQ